MQKEIFEQPTVVAQTLGSYLRRGIRSLRNSSSTFRKSAVTIVACGTSFYAGMVAKYWFEQFARVPVDIDVASEFRYRDPVLEEAGFAVHLAKRRNRRYAGGAAPLQGKWTDVRRDRQRPDEFDGP